MQKDYNDINTNRVKITQYRSGKLKLQNDSLCSEEPLEIRVPVSVSKNSTEYKTIAITMRTPGQDFDLAVGYLYGEGVVRNISDVVDMQFSLNRGEASARNSLDVTIKQPLSSTSHLLNQRFTTYSSCGLCGKTSMQSLELQDPPRLDEEHEILNASMFEQLSETMLEQQKLFNKTGASHASSLFDMKGNLLALSEDIGRHNALDKLIGYSLRELAEDLPKTALLISGRASFEMVQKAIMAGIPIIASAGAPSSLAVKTAQRFNLTLIGFLRSNSYNVYNAPWRLKN